MTDMLRLPLLDDADVASHALALGVDPRFLGLNVWRTLFANPAVAGPIYQFTTSLLFNGTIDARLRELIILRLGWKTRSPYEWGQHWIMAIRVGVSVDDAGAVRDWLSGEFDDRERSVLAAVDAMVDDGGLDAETWKVLRRHFPVDADVVEVLAVIANWRMVSGLLRAFDVPLDDVLELWPPDGRSPS
jgi:alkylhydroperoxidase family enzyme